MYRAPTYCTTTQRLLYYAVLYNTYSYAVLHMALMLSVVLKK